MSADMQTVISPDAPEQPGSSGILLALGWRIALVVTAAAAAAIGAPTWLTLPLTGLATLVVAEWAVRARGLGLLDSALVGIAAIILTAIGLGLILNLLPPGLTRPMWSLAAALAGVNVLLGGLGRDTSRGLLRQWQARLRPRPADQPKDGHSRLVGLVCAVLSVAVIVGAFVVSTGSANDAQVSPLEISAVTSPSGLEVTISTGTTGGSNEGPFDLILVASSVPTTVAVGIGVDEAHPITVPLAVPPSGRVLLKLVRTGTTDSVRELIFDSGLAVQAPPS